MGGRAGNPYIMRSFGQSIVCLLCAQGAAASISRFDTSCSEARDTRVLQSPFLRTFFRQASLGYFALGSVLRGLGYSASHPYTSMRIFTEETLGPRVKAESVESVASLGKRGRGAVDVHGYFGFWSPNLLGS